MKHQLALAAAATVVALLVAEGITRLPGIDPDYGRFIAEETPRWNEIVKMTGVKLE